MSKKRDYIKASRKGNREAELEDEQGWKAKHKVHSTKKQYNRSQSKQVTDEDDDIDFDNIFIYW